MRLCQHTFRDAAEQQLFERAFAVPAHHDQVAVLLLLLFNDAH